VAHRLRRPLTVGGKVREEKGAQQSRRDLMSGYINVCYLFFYRAVTEGPDCLRSD
jgi:hypothetical protein